MEINTAILYPDPGRPDPSAHPPRALRWSNGGVHWISSVVLLYAFLVNGETSGAMTRSVAMRGEVELGLIVGVIFLTRFIWVRSRRSVGGQWAAASLRLPLSRLRRLVDLAIYLGVAVTVVSGLLIACLRPGAVLVPGARGLTHSPGLNAAIITHVHGAAVLQWLCAFHVANALWYWKGRNTRWGKIAQARLQGWQGRWYGR